MNRRKHSKGFTIPEILVAGTLFALMVVAVTAGLRVALDVERTSDLRRQAAIQLRAAIDTTAVFRETNTYTCQLSLGGNPVNCAINVINNSTEYSIWGETTSHPHPHKYTIRITWESESIAYEVYN